jgi:hypothetical protein
VSASAANDDVKRTVTALSIVMEKIAPWLLDLGSWIFGALIAVNLLVLGALLTVGPVDAAVLVSTAALAVALPMAGAGFFLLRLAKDMKQLGLEELTVQAFEDVGFAVDEPSSAPTTSPSNQKERTARVLAYCYTLLTLSALLTLVTVTAALWHMAWWIGLVFVAVALISQVAVSRAISAFGSNAMWKAPSGAKERRTESKVPR